MKTILTEFTYYTRSSQLVYDTFLSQYTDKKLSPASKRKMIRVALENAPQIARVVISETITLS